MTAGEDGYLNELPDEVEMSLFDHLEELRQRIFYALIAVVLSVIGCFLAVKPIVQLLEVPAQGVKFLQLAPGEYFFVSIKVAGYSGLLLASPFVLYQIIQFVLPGLTRRERRLIGPVVLGSSVLFAAGIVFAYLLLIPAALNFFINYGADVVEQLWSIDRYFEFVLLLLFSTGLAFQIPIIQEGINRSNFLIEITVEAYDHRKALFVYKMRPKIIDGLLVDLYSVFGVIWHPEFHVDLVELKERLFQKCEEIVGKNVIKDILVQRFTTQREGKKY